MPQAITEMIKAMRRDRMVRMLVVTWVLLLGALLGSWGWMLAAPARANVLANTNASTVFAYQGQLRDGGNPAEGSYDFTFALYDALAGGTRLGAILNRPNVAVREGFFAVELDFGPVFSGAPRYLEIGVRPAGSTVAYTTLAPRQSLAPVPYARYADRTATVETWRTSDSGFFENSGYLGTSRVLLGAGFTDRFRVVFSARSTAVVVRAARVRLVSITNDTYNGNPSFQLEVYRQSDGQLLRTLLAEPINMRTQTPGLWVALQLSGNTTIATDEVLAVAITGNGTTGSLELGIDSEIDVEVQR